MLDLNVLPSLPVVPVTAQNCFRLVNKKALEQFVPPQHLFTSGAEGRFNSHGVPALYCSEDVATAGFEFDRYRPRDTPAPRQVLFTIQVTAPLLDVTDTANLTKLGVAEADMFAVWRSISKPGPTVTQLIGNAVAEQSRFAGIRFHSDAAKERGVTGCYNLVLFKKAVIAPSSVIVSDDEVKNVVDRWP